MKKQSQLRKWLEELSQQPGGILDVLADACAHLCGIDPDKQPGKLKTLAEVRTALDGAEAIGRIAGQISHSASLSAARVAFDAPFEIAQASDPRVRGIEAYY